MTRLKLKGLKARQIIAQGKASLRAPPWVSCPKDRKPCKGGTVQRQGIDGLTEASANNAKVPAGRTAWESGCDAKITSKANDDFSQGTPNLNSTFIFGDYSGG